MDMQSLWEHTEESEQEELQACIVGWLQTPDWETSQVYLQEHPQLLTETAEHVLEQLQYTQSEEGVRELIRVHQSLLYEARAWGIDNTYTYFSLAEQAVTLDKHEQKRLLRQLHGWLAAPTWEQAQAYLKKHPDLLTGSAEYFLASWWLRLQTHQEQVSIAWHLLILQRARIYGVKATYSWLPDPVLLNQTGLVAIEARAVAERFGMEPLLGADATTSAVLARLAEATHVHLATHAFFDADDPLSSGIVLADGVLTARDILQHRLQADLLVLSACESGQVSSLGGEELAGFSQTFLQAGVRSLLVSLWRVNDPATAALMQAFYDARAAGADKVLALWQAMTQIQQDQRWVHPFYWGAFILVGDCE